MLTIDKNVKRETNGLAMLLYSYIYDKLENALKDDSFILSENNLPIVLDVEGQIVVYGWLKSIFEESKTLKENMLTIETDNRKSEILLQQ